MLVLGALPLFYMEVILGQFNRQGPISLWKICPLFKGDIHFQYSLKMTNVKNLLFCILDLNLNFAGVGYCAVFIAFYVSFYYNVIIAWSLFYVFNRYPTFCEWDTLPLSCSGIVFCICHLPIP